MEHLADTLERTEEKEDKYINTKISSFTIQDIVEIQPMTKPMGYIYKAKKIYIICLVRMANDKYRNKLLSYTTQLENVGNIVYYPFRDTPQYLSSMAINKYNFEAIKNADEIHIFYDSKSQGIHFDMGMAFALNKKIQVLEIIEEEVIKGSYPELLHFWEQS